MKALKNIFALTIIATVFFCSCSPKEQGIGIVAHRGYWNCEEAGYTQNSIASLKAAQDAGVWGSEFDVFLTSDNQLVVNHDAVFQGLEIEKTPYDRIREIVLPNGERIPNIDEYLEQGKKCPTTVLVYEVKSHALTDEQQDLIADMSVAKIKEHGLDDPSRVIFIAFSYRICKRIAEQLPEFTVQYLSSDKEPAVVYADKVNGIDYFGPAFLEHPEWIQQAHDLGMSVNVWTINKEDEMKHCYEAGVDFITTDQPMIARKVIEENGFKENVISPLLYPRGR